MFPLVRAVLTRVTFVLAVSLYIEFAKFGELWVNNCFIQMSIESLLLNCNFIQSFCGFYFRIFGCILYPWTNCILFFLDNFWAGFASFILNIFVYWCLV